MKCIQQELFTSVVSERDRQGREARARWAWVEPEVWTDHMLAALENGVKGGKWFSLNDKVSREKSLQLAWEQVRRNGGSAGIDAISVKRFAKIAEKELTRLSRELREGAYRPKPVKRVWIRKLGSKEKRPLGVPTVRDRIVQSALRLVIEPIFERDFAAHSYGFRPVRGCKDALRQVVRLLKAGYIWVVDADLESYFDTIAHEKLMHLVEERISDQKVLELIRSFLTQGVMESHKGWQPTDRGTPQGAVVSPLLSNIYLNGLDHEMARKGYQMVRYADDFIILCRSQKEAQGALKEVQQWTRSRELILHPEKTKIVDATVKGGFDFLGYHFERGYRWPPQKSLKGLREKIRTRTKRTNGTSMSCIISKLNPILKGWFEYYKHSHQTTFSPIDGWVRMRLRSIMRKRHKRKGRGRGKDHQRWPNAYFADLGLYNLHTAWEHARQPPWRS